MRRFLALVLLAIVPMHHSHAAQQAGEVLMFGGGFSCATWLTQNYESGKVWIWGYWTGRNIVGFRARKRAVPAP